MKLNAYHFFAAACIGISLTILVLLLFGCTTEPEPHQRIVKLHCVQDTIIPGQTCYFQASFGDTVNGLILSDIDSILIVGATGTAPRDIDCQIRGKYCQLRCFYIDCQYRYLPCCMYINADGVNLYESCTNGISRPVLIN